MWRFAQAVRPQFDRGDLRVLASLSEFASLAYQVRHQGDELRDAHAKERADLEVRATLEGERHELETTAREGLYRLVSGQTPHRKAGGQVVARSPGAGCGSTFEIRLPKLVPFEVAGVAVGTVWAIAHDEARTRREAARRRIPKRSAAREAP
jgi:hypothetical protein